MGSVVDVASDPTTVQAESSRLGAPEDADGRLQATPRDLADVYQDKVLQLQDLSFGGS